MSKTFKFTGPALLVIPAFLILLAGVFLLGGWVLMILLGLLHSFVWAAIPALGFWPSVVVYAALSFIAGLFKRSN